MNPNDTTLYVVYWGEHDILKVGVTNSTKRIQKHRRTGAILLEEVPHSTTQKERAAIEHLSWVFDRAFPTFQSAEPVLGQWGIGYTECFRVPERHLWGAMKMFEMGLASCP